MRGFTCEPGQRIQLERHAAIGNFCTGAKCLKKPVQHEISQINTAMMQLQVANAVAAVPGPNADLDYAARTFLCWNLAPRQLRCLCLRRPMQPQLQYCLCSSKFSRKSFTSHLLDRLHHHRIPTVRHSNQPHSTHATHHSTPHLTRMFSHHFNSRKQRSQRSRRHRLWPKRVSAQQLLSHAA